MGDIAMNIRRLRQLFDLTQLQLAEIAGVSNQAVSNWENGESQPKMGRLQRIADHFGLSVSALVEDGVLDRVDPVTRRVRPDGAITPRAANTGVPVYGRIAAGTPIEAMPVEDSYWLPPEVLADHPRCFFLRVEGESMNRVLPNGTLALIDPDAEVRNGDVAAVTVNGHDATIKRVLRGTSSITLAPDSRDPGFTDMIFDYSKPDTDTVGLIGLVVWQLVPYGRRL